MNHRVTELMLPLSAKDESSHWPCRDLEEREDRFLAAIKFKWSIRLAGELHFNDCQGAHTHTLAIISAV